MSGFDHLVTKVIDAANCGIGHLSTGEALAAALVLNRGDWLAKMGFTISQALERIGPEWASMIPAAAMAAELATSAITQAEESSAIETTLSALSSSSLEANVNATLVTYGNAPGYRDVSITLDVERLGGATKHRLSVNISADDSGSIARHILEVQRLAWEGSGPIDKKPGEVRPKWIN